MKNTIANSVLWAAAMLVTAILDDPQQSVPLMAVCAVMSIMMMDRALKRS
jgi:hypothetical protein